MRASGFEEFVLCGCQAHLTAVPVIQVNLVVQSKVFAEFPATTLLLTPRSRIVRQISIGVVVKEARHDLASCGQYSKKTAFTDTFIDVTVPACGRQQQNRSFQLDVKKRGWRDEF